MPLVFFYTAALVATAMSLLWLLSVAMRDASIVDPFWGTGFVLIAWCAALTSSGAPSRRALLLAMVTLWGARLTLHLLARRGDHGEDFRYRAMRAAQGPRFVWLSFFTVFALQGALMWCISLPLQSALSARAPATLTWLDGLGAVVWAIGLFFEAVGDLQLTRFRADPSKKSQVLDTGLWRYTRHPNYFGDALLWWGFGLVACATGAWWTLVGPLAMTLLLLKVSGVALLEKTLVETRPKYRDYVRQTSAFIPMPPKT